MNAAVDPALLQLVQQHVNALKIDLDKMAFELEGDRKVVKKALQDVKADLDQLEKQVLTIEERFGSLESDVQQRVAQVKQRISSAIPQISCGNKIIAVTFLVWDCKKYEVTGMHLLL